MIKKTEQNKEPKQKGLMEISSLKCIKLCLLYIQICEVLSYVGAYLLVLYFCYSGERLVVALILSVEIVSTVAMLFNSRK